MTTWGVPALLCLALAFALGPAGLAVAGIASFLWLAWRFDNDAGTFLVLAILLLVAVAVIAMLLTLMAVTH